MDWVAVRNGDVSRLLRQFELTPYGHVSDESSVVFALGDVGGGWVVLTAFKGDLSKDDTISRLAQACGEVVANSIVENVGYSQVEAYKDGKKSWSVTYDSEKNVAGVAVEGRPPEELEAILNRCDALYADDPDVMYHYDAPIDVAKLVCGYQPMERDAIAWQALVPASEARNLPSLRSLPAAIRAELLPSLEARGWTVAPDRSFVGPHGITRQVGPFTQSIGFWFRSGKETKLTVQLREMDTKSAGKTYFEYAMVSSEPDRRPAWKRWFGLSKPAAPSDPIAAAITTAQDDIVRAEAYFEGRERDPRIRILGSLGRRDDVAG